MLLHSGLGHIGFLGGRHTLASLLSSVDVHCCDRIELSPESVGVFYRNLCRGFVELRKHLRNDFLVQRPPTALSMDSHRASRAAGFDHRGACMVRKSDCHHRLCLGVFTAAHEISGRRRQALGCLRSHDCVFGFGYGPVPASLSRHLPSTLTPSSALTVRLFPQPSAICLAQHYICAFNILGVGAGLMTLVALSWRGWAVWSCVFG